MPKKVDPHKELSKIINRAAKADARAAYRIERLWSAVFNATYATNVDPLDQLAAVLLALQQAGSPTPGLVMQISEKGYAAKIART